MPYFKVFARAKNFSLDLGDGNGLRRYGFYTGKCIDADDEENARRQFREELLAEIISDLSCKMPDYEQSEIEIEEIEQVDGYDESYNIGRAIYEADDI